MQRVQYIRLLLIFALNYLCLFSTNSFATPEEDYAIADKFFIEEDIKEATKFLRLSADQNYLPAQVRMGDFMNGSDEYEEAFGWFFTAAIQGDAEGQYRLGQMYALGTGIEQSTEKALYWTKKSADQKFLPAVELMATSYSPLTPLEVERKITRLLGLTPDQSQADFWSAQLPDLQKAAAKKKRLFQAAIDKKNADLKKAADEKIKLEKIKSSCLNPGPGVQPCN